MNMMFTNRSEAGKKLAMRLEKYANRDDVIVLGTPRGGVPVAFEVATALKLPLDVFVLRKLGVPGHEELAFGAIASGGVRVIDQDIVDGHGMTAEDVEEVTRIERREMQRRERAYRGGRGPLNVSGLVVILVDDGIATGASIRAGIRALRQMKPARIVVAVPVAPPSTCDHLRAETDELVVLEKPEIFFGVGQFYTDFSEVSDEQVIDLLTRAWHQSAEPKVSGAEIAHKGARQ
jgi:putative phosphoribosyl transferase